HAMNRGYGARLGSLIHRAISSAFIMLARIGSTLRGAFGPNLAFARVRGGRNTHHGHAAALRDVDARERGISHTLAAADCDGVLPLVLKYQSNRPLADLWRKPSQFVHDSIVSNNGVPWNPGTIHVQAQASLDFLSHA